MLLAVLLHLLVIHLLTPSDASLGKDTEYKIKPIDTCPDVGYFLKKEATGNSLEPQACHLCFCQEDNTAVCWKRDNRRCSKESFHYHGVGKRDTRIKRSPGFADIFFRDAARDYFNRNNEPQCKPYGSSISNDCPPADWCTGCTVCDCDANGHWDCHLLSFCSEDQKKTKRQLPSPPPPGSRKPPPGSRKPAPGSRKPPPGSRKPPPGSRKPPPGSRKPPPGSRKPPPGSRAPPAGSRAPPPGSRVSPPGSWPPLGNKKIKVNKTSSVRPPKKKSIPVKKYKITTKANNKITSQAKKKPLSTPKRITKKNVPRKSGVKPKPGKIGTPVQYTKGVMPSKQNSTKLFKKNVGASKPVNIKSSKSNFQKELAHKVVKKFVQNLKKSVSAKAKNITSEKPIKMDNEIKDVKVRAKLNHLTNKKKDLHKRQIKKPTNRPPHKISKETMKKPIFRAKGKTVKKPSAREHVRNRREIRLAGTVGVLTGSSTESTKTTEPLLVMPLLSNSLGPDTEYFLHPALARSTYPDNKYYKYVVSGEETRIKMNGTKEDTASPQFNITETVFDLIGGQFDFKVSTEKATVHSIKTEAYKSINFTEMIPKMNKLNCSKWSNLKIMKEKNNISDPDIKHNKRLMKWLSQHTNKTTIRKDKNRDFVKKIERKVNRRKYSKVKLLSHSKSKRINSSYFEMATENKGDLHNFLTKLLNDTYKNSTTYPTYRSNRRRKGVLKYLRGIFNKIFKSNKRSDHFNKHQLIDALCANFGPCKVNRKDKALLNSKLTDLDRETKTILKIVRIIKGLLKLLELPETVNNDAMKPVKVQNDIEKLNVILKGNFSENEQAALTDTQRSQIEYIKRSTQDFIKSVNKFALLINEIIAILTKEKNNRFKIDTQDHFLNKNKDPFQSLRNLLRRYNLVQNQFMNHMYEQLKNFENKIIKKPKVSDVKDLNSTVEIETISRNIIQNLRKLKRLAQTMSCSGRTKREVVRDDDAIEYLLMLMEYLVKQKHPLDVEPANDGIDLLIEAIKNAPDIKPIKKKVLEDAPMLYTHITTTTTPKTDISETSLRIEENPRDISSIKNFHGISDDGDKSNLEATEIKFSENKDLLEIVADDDKDFEDKQFDRRAEPSKTTKNTEMTFSFFRKFGNNQDPENIFATTTFKNILDLEMEISDKLGSRDDTTTTENALVLENSYSDKPIEQRDRSVLDKPIDQSEGKGEKKIEVFAGDMDDDIILPKTVTTTESDIPITLPSELFQTQAMTHITKKLFSNKESIVNQNIDYKTKLKWIEENFGKETETQLKDFDDNNSTLDTTVITPITTKPESGTVKVATDVSSITKEKDVDSGSKRDSQRDKLSAEEIMFRKQMDLLNSLDYGTERQDADLVESKDSNVEDRYTGDNFPSYFV